MDIIDWFKNATLVVKIITGVLVLTILLLLLSLFTGGKSKTNVATTNTGGKDFEEIQLETPTPAPTTIIPTPIPTSYPTTIPTDTPIPTIIPTSTPIPTNTPAPTNPPQPVIRSTSTPIPTIYPEVLHLSAYRVELYPGEQQEIKATIIPSGVFNNTVTWTVENSHVARIESAKNRLIITAATPGTTKIIAKTINDKTAEILITIKDTRTQPAPSVSNVTLTSPTAAASTPIPTRAIIEPSSISINQPQLSLETNRTIQLTVTYTPDTTNRRHLNWSSSNISVATVDVSGRVTAVNPGTATITASSVNGQTSRSTITVPGTNLPLPTSTKTPTSVPTRTPTNIPTQIPTRTPTRIPTPIPTTAIINPTGINLSATSVKLYSGEIQKISASVVPANAANKSLQWSSNNPTIATVNSLGYITAKTPGTTTVVVKTSNNITKSISVEVNRIPVPTIIPTLPIINDKQGTITHESYGGMQYILYLPYGFTKNRDWPLLVYLHGWEREPNINNMYKQGHIPRLLRDGNNYNAVVVAPFSTRSWGYSSNQQQAKAIIDHVVSQYNINKSKISLTCHSDGCWGGTALVRNNSTFFSSLVAVASSAPSSNSASGFTSTKIYYWYGTSDADSTNRSAFVNSINQAGGQAYIKSIAGGHNIMKQVYIDNKMIEWMLSQSR